MPKTLAREYQLESRIIRAAKKEGFDLLMRSHFERWDWGERHGIVTETDMDQARHFFGESWYTAGNE
jgi:hypothetical protein